MNDRLLVFNVKLRSTSTTSGMDVMSTPWLDACLLVQLDFGFNHPVLLIREERASCLCVLFLTPSYFSSSFPASDFSSPSLPAGSLVERMEKVQGPERNDMRLIKRVAVITQGQGLRATAKHKVVFNQLTSRQTRSALLGSFRFANHRQR